MLEENNDHLPVAIIAREVLKHRTHTFSHPQEIQQPNNRLLVTTCTASKLNAGHYNCHVHLMMPFKTVKNIHLLHYGYYYYRQLLITLEMPGCVTL